MPVIFYDRHEICDNHDVKAKNTMNAAKHLIFPLRIQQWMHKDHEEKISS